MTNAVINASICPQCQAEFGCGSSDTTHSPHTDAGCWCQQLPAIMPLEPSRDCLCPNCLARLIGAEITRLLDAAGSAKARLALAEPYRHQTNLVEYIDYTIDEQGRYVFSEWYHLKRARCCGNGCRHCPYNE